MNFYDKTVRQPYWWIQVQGPTQLGPFYVYHMSFHAFKLWCMMCWNGEIRLCHHINGHIMSAERFWKITVWPAMAAAGKKNRKNSAINIKKCLLSTFLEEKKFTPQSAGSFDLRGCSILKKNRKTLVFGLWGKLQFP